MNILGGNLPEQNKADSDWRSYSELLALAHTKGIKSLSLELIQAPNAANKMTAICKATVVMANEVSYTDIGEASPSNVSDEKSMSCVVSVASTRSKSRALRDALGVSENNDQSALEPEFNTKFVPATFLQKIAFKKVFKQVKNNLNTKVLSALNKSSAGKLITKLNDEMKKTT